MTRKQILALLRPTKRETTALLVYDIRDAKQDKRISLAAVDALCEQGIVHELCGVTSGPERYFCFTRD